jgi:large subunit ribosomal protein L2
LDMLSWKLLNNLGCPVSSFLRYSLLDFSYAL